MVGLGVIVVPQLNARELASIARVGMLSQECISEEQFGEIMMREMLDLFDSRSAAFLEFEPGDGESALGGNTLTFGLDNRHSIAYRDHYHQFDPCFSGLRERLRLGQGAAISTDMVVGNKHEYVESSYYQDFLAPTRVHQSLVFGIGSRQRLNGLVGLHRRKDQAAYNAADHLKVRLIAPYLSTAIMYRQKDRAYDRQSALQKLFLYAPSADAYLLFDNKLSCTDAGGELELVSALLGTGLAGGTSGLRLPPDLEAAVRKAMAEYNRGGAGTGYESLVLSRNIRATLTRGENGRILVLLSFLRSEIRMVSRNRMRLYRLTPRQEEVVELIKLGFENAQIARKLNISVKTVENHLTEIYDKTRTHNRTSLLLRLFI